MGKPALAMAIAYHCVRNTQFLEDLHSGPPALSKTGDYSDVKVVTPYGEIPWTEVSRITDEEMKELMIAVTDSIYTGLVGANLLANPVPDYWKRPKLLPRGL